MADEKIEDLVKDTRIKINRAIDALEDELSRERSETPPQTGSSPNSVDAATLLAHTKQFAAAQTQVELLSLLVELASSYAPRVLLLIRKGSNLHGWAGNGFTPEFMGQNLKKLKWSIDAYPELARVIHQFKPLISNFSELSDLSDEITNFDGFMPFKACFFPLTVKNKVAAVLYCDSGPDAGLGENELVEVLCYFVGLELTMVTSKLKSIKEEESGKVAPQAPSPPPAEKQPEPAVRIPEIEPTQSNQPDPPMERSGVLAESEDSSINKAKRVARVLVSDLKLYNEQAVMQGVRQKKLYQVLQDDLDRSYKHYQERVSGLLTSSDVNYFKEELINQLGKGDPAALGPLPF